MWEGWDEYAHFAFVQHWIDRGTLPRTADRISREIDESMRLAPLPWELRWIGPPYLTHADWWALPESARAERMRGLASLLPAWAHEPAVPIEGRRPFVFYEAQQPPLFYWVACAVMRPAESWPIGTRVLLLRLLSVLLASAVIPFAFLAARRSLGLDGACCVSGLLAVAPGLMIDAAHVANDGLAIGISAVFLWLMTRENMSWIPVGITLGAAILVKASMLVLVPILIVLWIRRPRQVALALGAGLATGGWWYCRNLLIGMPLTGWQESVQPGALVMAGLALFQHGGWVNEVHTIAKSFTWFGAWSFITLRTWMYLLLEGVAFAGMLSVLATRRPGLRVPFVFTICFTVAIIGGAAAYYAVHNIAGIPGWYLWPVGAALAILIVAGLGRFSVAFAGMLALTDLFGAALRMMPYYAGLAERLHGSVAQFPLAAARLHVPAWLAVAWIAATITIPLLMFQGRAKTRM
jgi:hypothetical protein